MTPRYLTAIWFATTLGIGGYLASALSGGGRAIYLPGPTTDGHYQIEIECAACHTPFGGVRQGACLDCHEAELEAAQDSHPRTLFTDPRTADQLAKLDARRCVACHVEHRPEITARMGVTVPADHCHHCHAEIAEERPTHVGLTFDTCAAAGCHNFHDNRALYEDFLVNHGASAAATFASALPERNGWISWERPERAALTAEQLGEAPISAPALAEAWAGSAHASGMVGCVDCHAAESQPWRDRPGSEACEACHELEAAGFAAGRHGMRPAAGLEPMSPADARLPMQADALSRTLDCNSCHDAHAVDVRRAAVEACLACHADEHSTAYADSPHFRLWQAEVSGAGKPGSGVSCASCHLPREARGTSSGERIVVQHNQNANLRPNEKMIREVCLTCHSLALSIDALADPGLIRRNFSGSPARHVPSIEMALSRDASPSDPKNTEPKEPR